MKESSTKMNSDCLKGNSNTAKLNPAKELTSNPSATVEIETQSELTMARGKSPNSNGAVFLEGPYDHRATAWPVLPHRWVHRYVICCRFINSKYKYSYYLDELPRPILLSLFCAAR
jgi:hypothetical protein